jgi:NifU-like protein involved in Fe-S cluster formation
VEFVEGKTVGEARVLDEAAIVAALGHMPLGREHCPGLAIKALKHALDQLDGSTN